MKKQEKSTKDWESQNGGVGHLQIPKQNPQLGQNAHVTKKLQIFNILQILHF